MKRARDTKNVVWEQPTRRVFVTMLGAAAAALALPKPEVKEPPPPPLPRWIGHF